MKFLRVISPLLLLLSACAPTVAGSTESDPVVVTAGEPVEVEQGSETYLGLEYGLDDFDLSPAALASAFWIPAGVNAESANLVTRFSLRDPRVPIRWSLELSQIRVERTFETRFGQQTGTVTYRLAPVLLLRVPADAPLGVSTIRAELVARGGESKAIEVPVRVRAPSND